MPLDAAVEPATSLSCSNVSAGRVACLTSDEELEDLRADWDALFDALGPAHPSSGFAWVMHWRRYLQRHRTWHHAQLHVYTVRGDDGVLRAVIPCTVCRVAVLGIPIAHWIQVGISSFCTEPTRLLVDPSHEAMAVRAVTAHMRRGAPDLVLWAGLVLGGEGMAYLIRNGGAALEDVFSCQMLYLPDLWSDFDAGLSRKTRRTLRHNYRLLSAQQRVMGFQVHTAPEAIEASLTSFLALHLERNGPRRSKVFHEMSTEETVTFLRSLVGDLARDEGACMFEFQVDGRPVAMRIGFISKGVLWLYLFADDPRWKKHGVLTLMTAELLKHGIASGLRVIYVATGRSQSIHRWRPQLVDFACVAVWSATWRARLLQRARAARHRILAMRTSLATSGAHSAVFERRAQR